MKKIEVFFSLENVFALTSRAKQFTMHHVQNRFDVDGNNRCEDYCLLNI
jgi:hypothetical protein